MSNGAGAPQAGLEALKKITHLVYALQAASFLFGITAIAGIVLNYIKRAETRGTWLESHFRWQIRTFWFGLLWTVLALATLVVGIGVLVGLAATVWLVYRIVKGWVFLRDGRAMYVG